MDYKNNRGRIVIKEYKGKANVDDVRLDDEILYCRRASKTPLRNLSLNEKLNIAFM